jgi:filamentous hemagglutinin family protein
MPGLVRSLLTLFVLQPLRVGLWLLVALPANAQVRGDNTLPTPTQVQRQGDAFDITGGTQRGGNLFHSFERFSPGDRNVTFRNVDNVERLITRVTGGSASEINGILRILQSNGQISPADFFLINPNGILFGESARLDVGGSAIFSTAERLNFADGDQFSARDPQASPLLTVSIPTGLQFGSSPAPIVNASFIRAANFSDALNEAGYFGAYEGSGLSVSAGRAIALIGGNVDFSGGETTTQGGRIELGSVAQAGTVGLVPVARGWSVEYSGIQAFGQISLTGQADISANGDRAGTIRLRASEIRLDEASYISADTLGRFSGGRIFIQGDRLTLLNGSQIFADTRSSGAAGRIEIDSDRVTLLNGSQISANTDSSGAAGILNIRASDRIDLLGTVPGEDGPASSSLLVRVNKDATGDGGRIVLATRQLNLLDGGQISIDTNGSGQPGSLQILADEINIAGVALGGQAVDELGLPFPSSVSALIAGPQSFQSTGTIPSQIDIQTQRLRVQNGATIQTSTVGTANAGNLSIRASERIEVGGLAPASPAGLAVPAGIFSQSGGTPGTPYIFAPEATGRGGDLSIVTGELLVRDGAYIATGSFDSSPNALGAGNLTVATRSARLENRGNIVANTNSGIGGNLNFTVQDYLVLRRNSQISTTAGIAGQGGNGGNIRLTADVILSVLAENSDITANAFSGDGGRVDVFTRGITGILPQPQLTPQSDITATSARGNSGTITISTPPSTDPTQGVTELPVVPVDASRLIAQRCAASSAIATERSAFVITGRGGLPPSPTNALDQPSLSGDWAADWADVAPSLQGSAPVPASGNLAALPAPADADSRTSSLALQKPANAAFAPAPGPLQEARGWQQTAAGEVMLVANVPQPEISQSVQPLPGCAASG